MSIQKPYAIAAGHQKTSEAAEVILNQGGNAYDAILAAMMMSFVAEPLLSSPGGGGFLLAAGPKLPAKLIDFFSDTPSIPAADIDQGQIDFYPIVGDFGTRSQEFHIGRAAATVPGVPAGIFKIHQTLCTLPLNEIAQPAIKAAQQGIEINHQQAYVALILKPIIEATAESKALYGGMHAGHVWKNQQLAVFLDTLSKSDHDGFYQGRIAQAISEQENGLLKSIDFTDYKCLVREPLQLELGDYQILTNPQPSTGGHLILEQLKRLKTRADAVAVLEAMQHADALKRNPLAAVSGSEVCDSEVSRGTTHMSITDRMGNLASLTLSNGEGNGQVVDDCGFMLNNFLGEEDINTGGFFSWEKKQRMRSMMSPTIMIHPEKQIALGTGGSNRIKTALFQVLNHLINGKQILKHAVEAPRMHFENGFLDLEPGFKITDGEKLKRHHPIYSEWHNHNLYFGGVNAVQTGKTVTAIGDFRRNGCGIVGN